MSELRPGPRDKLIELLKKNPPELYMRLSTVIDNRNFNDSAKTTAQNITYLINEVEKMNIHQIKELWYAVIEKK